ncbi:hypothetical protein STAS_25214 [Striga asiatica]|uniref:Uncharacterized protein n=1 Tax=Striga asiatica TaxID=4170 RepID=A0A5A7QT15_STRAF|nr:hypothetical protein STAS_25214 [Striga asiatica]
MDPPKKTVRKIEQIKVSHTRNIAAVIASSIRAITGERPGIRIAPAQPARPDTTPAPLVVRPPPDPKPFPQRLPQHAHRSNRHIRQIPRRARAHRHRNILLARARHVAPLPNQPFRQIISPRARSVDVAIEPVVNRRSLRRRAAGAAAVEKGDVLVAVD